MNEGIHEEGGSRRKSGTTTEWKKQGTWNVASRFKQLFGDEEARAGTWESRNHNFKQSCHLPAAAQPAHCRCCCVLDYLANVSHPFAWNVPYKVATSFYKSLQIDYWWLCTAIKRIYWLCDWLWGGTYYVGSYRFKIINFNLTEFHSSLSLWPTTKEPTKCGHRRGDESGKVS